MGNTIIENNGVYTKLHFLPLLKTSRPIKIVFITKLFLFLRPFMRDVTRSVFPFKILRVRCCGRGRILHVTNRTEIFPPTLCVHCKVNIHIFYGLEVIKLTALKTTPRIMCRR